MPSFLKDIHAFYGTGERNADGQTLEEFLDAYDPDQYRTPSCTVDCVILSGDERTLDDDSDLEILLVRRSNHPCIGFWALPGGFVEMEEDLSDAAKRELYEETKVTGLAMEQLAAYGDYQRDPRTRVITTAYMALVDKSDLTVQAGDDAADAAWCQIRLEEEKAEERKDLPAGDWEIHQYQLRVQNDKRGLDTEAHILHQRRKGLIREEKYEVLSPGMIISDHAAMITQALITLRERMA